MTTADLAALARESIAAFNRSDFGAIRAMAAPGYVYEETGTGRRVDDLDVFVGMLESWKAAIPDVNGDVRRVVVDGDTTVLEILWSGTQTGPLETPGGVVPASGNRAEFWGVMWAQWRDGLMVAERHHLDVLTLLASIGAIPAPASA